MGREEIVNNIGYQLTRAAVDYIEKHEFADSIDSFEAGAEWMLEQFEKWLRKTGKGQLIGSLNRFLEGMEVELVLKK